MGARACAAILLAWERCEHLRKGRLVLVLFCLWLAVVWPVSALLGGLIGVCAWLFDVPHSDRTTRN